VTHRIEPTLVASFDRTGPGIGSDGARVVVQIEDMDDAFPHRFALKTPLTGSASTRTAIRPCCPSIACLSWSALTSILRHYHAFTARSFRTFHLLSVRGVLRARDDSSAIRQLVLVANPVYPFRSLVYEINIWARSDRSLIAGAIRPPQEESRPLRAERAIARLNLAGNQTVAAHRQTGAASAKPSMLLAWRRKTYGWLPVFHCRDICETLQNWFRAAER
jgi:hypothetical protein